MRSPAAPRRLARALGSLMAARCRLSALRRRLGSTATMGELSEGGSEDARRAIDLIEARLGEARRVRDLLSESDPRLGLLFSLRYAEAMSWHQVTDCMGISQSRAMQLNRALIAVLGERPELRGILETVADACTRLH